MNPSLQNFPIWPRQASQLATEVDWLIWVFTITILLLVVPIFIATVYFPVKYRHGRAVNRDNPVERSVGLEVSWTLIPWLITLVFFAWAAYLYYQEFHAPPNALEISAIGRQWMWKFEHPGGQSEINTLHVPVGRPVKIVMISQDVIHGLFVPELRNKRDVLPGRYTEMWFEANQIGTYRIFCSVFCGTDHSQMRGLMEVMDPAAYQAWLDQAGTDLSLAAQGAELFRRYGCSGCHFGSTTVRAPRLEGLYGREVPLAGGRTATFDDRYIRDSILYPNKDVAAGYNPIMPSFEGRVGEDDLIKLIAYIRSLGDKSGGPR